MIDDAWILSEPLRVRLLRVLTENYTLFDEIADAVNADHVQVDWQLEILWGCGCVNRKLDLVNGKIKAFYVVTPKGRRVVNGSRD